MAGQSEMYNFYRIGLNIQWKDEISIRFSLCEKNGHNMLQNLFLCPEIYRWAFNLMGAL